MFAAERQAIADRQRASDERARKKLEVFSPGYRFGRSPHAHQAMMAVAQPRALPRGSTGGGAMDEGEYTLSSYAHAMPPVTRSARATPASSPVGGGVPWAAAWLRDSPVGNGSFCLPAL